MRRRIQRTFASILCLIMAITVIGPAASAVDLPKKGTGISGFTVTDTGYEELISAETITFTHQKSGGTVYYIAADDTNKAFDITFRTPALDNTGTPHIFEHITISGSEKYPYQNLFFPLASQTYNTFINAMTGTSSTTYPLASLSQEQLMALADYYLDGVFNPLIHTEEKLYKRESWRYELESPDSPLNLTGTVYNEMRGAGTIERAAYLNIFKTLYPGSILGNDPGGAPESIPDVTWQQLKDFHSEYYHPSNALVVLYGQMDIEPFLALINEYFSQFDKKEIYVESGAADALTSLQRQTYYYPAGDTADAANSSIVSYSVSLGNETSDMDVRRVAVLAQVINQSSSPLNSIMSEHFPRANVIVGVDTETVMPTLIFEATNIDGSKAESFKECVDAALEHILENGLDQSVIDAGISSLKYQTYTINEGGTAGVNYIITQSMDWAITGNTDIYNNFDAAIREAEKDGDSEYFEKLLDKFVISNPHKALVTTIPRAGLAQENRIALEEKLAQVKEGMSDGEIAALVASTKELSEWSIEEPPSDVIESLQKITVQTLPEEVKQYDISETVWSGINIISAQTSTPKISGIQVMLDASHISQEDLHFYRLYASMLGGMPTEKYSQSEVFDLSSIYLNNLSISTSYVTNTDGDFQPVLFISALIMNDSFAKSADILQQILFYGDYNYIQLIDYAIESEKTALEYRFQNGVYSELYRRALAAYDFGSAYGNYLTGLDYYEFLIQAQEALESDPQVFLDKFEDISYNLRTKSGAIIMLAGDEQACSNGHKLADGIFTGIPSADRERAVYEDIPIPTSKEAIITDSALQYNLIYAPLWQLQVEDTATLPVLSQIIYNGYLTPQIRHIIGAYDNLTVMDDSGAAFISYRDPGIVATFKAYEGLADYLRNSTLTQRDVDRYIISVYSTYAAPTGDMSDALNALNYYILGFEQDYVTDILAGMKTMTPGDVKNFARAAELLAEEGFRSTGGNSAVIEQNKELFDTIINFSAMDRSVPLTRGEFISIMFDGDPDAVELAAEYGVLRGDESGYRLGDIMTREEFAVFLFRALELPAEEYPGVIADYDAISPWAMEAVETMLSGGCITLDGEGCVDPKGNVYKSDFNKVIEVLMTQYIPVE